MNEVGDGDEVAPVVVGQQRSPLTQVVRQRMEPVFAAILRQQSLRGQMS